MNKITPKQWTGIILLAMAVVVPYCLVWLVLGITPLGILIGVGDFLFALVGVTFVTDKKGE